MIGLLKCQVSQKKRNLLILLCSHWFCTYFQSLTLDHNYSLLNLNHISFHKWMYFFLAFSFIKIRKYRIVIEFIHVLDALSWLKMSLTFRSDFIDNMHTFYNVAKNIWICIWFLWVLCIFNFTRYSPSFGNDRRTEIWCDFIIFFA